MKKIYDVSFRTYYANGNKCDHHQNMELTGIRKWIEAYSYTHPDCESITVKVWLHDEGGNK